MEIFYIKKSEFLQKIDLKSLDKFEDGRKFLMPEKRIEHLLGIFLVKFIGRNFFKLSDTTIEIKDKKPYFKLGKIHFSISHSKDIVLAAFETSNIGVDVEYMKERDFNSLIARFDNSIQNPTKEDFYRFWTREEAQIKLNSEIKSICSTILEQDYILTLTTERPIASSFHPSKLAISDGENVNLYSEYNTPDKVFIV